MVPSKKKTPLDLDKFALDGEQDAPVRNPLPGPRRGELYLSSRIPMSWVEAAAVLPGRAWHLACALWFEAACRKCAAVSLPANTRRRFGLAHRRTFYRALDALAEAGLIAVDRRTGKNPVVTILDTPNAEQEEKTL
jgi:hypothetical protein